MKFTITMGDILLVSPLIALFLASLIPLTIKVLKGNVEQRPVATLAQALLGIITSAGLLIVFGGTGQTAFNDVLVFDGITQWTGLIALVAAAGSLILMYENPATRGPQFSELVFLALSSVLGMLILISALDLLMIFIGLETMSLALYIMIGMSHEQRLSKESAFKYFVLGSFASAIFLFGISFVYGSSGQTNILKLLETAMSLIQTNKMYLFGTVLILVGFCFKVSIAPFHAWTPDVYQGAPTPHTAFMATAVKVVSFAAFLRVIATRPLVASDSLFEVLQWLAVITMLVGNTAAILQNNLKRMLAYSSIAHSGYIMVGLLTAGVSENGTFAASSVIFYLFSYSLMTIGSFALVSMMEKTEDHSLEVDDLAGFAQRRPVLAISFSVFMFSLAGLPPSLGFFSKFYLFNAAIGEGLLWLAIWGVINSVISVYYYLRPIVVMYMKDGESDVAYAGQYATAITIVITALLTLFLGVVSGPLLAMVENSLI
ncbi:MAG: NADH-quinone oxidoreductase subunit N [Bdellovibrionales bacterium]